MIIIPKRRWDYPVAYERSYCKIMRAYVARIEEALKDSLDDMAAVLDKNGPKMDSYESDLDALLTKIGARIDKKAAETALRRKVEQMYTGVNDFNEEEFKAVIRDAVGAEDFFINEKWQKVVRSVWVQENISLIKSIRSQTLEKIRYSLGDMVTEAADKQTRAAQLSEAIQDIAHKNRTRADLIARDQIGKLNGRLTQLRQQSAGITKYKWSTSKDERVRPAHAEREGKVYEWANPPADGNPGYPIRCRCVAIPVIDTDTLGMPVMNPGNGIINTGNTLKSGTTKLQATMTPDEYNEFVDIINKNADVSHLYASYADKVADIEQIPGEGSYNPRRNSIIYSFRTARNVSKGMNKYETVAHEYGHFFDFQVPWKNVNFAEVDELNRSVVIGTGRIKLFKYKPASLSDEFLGALRKDKEHIRREITLSKFADMMKTDASADVQEVMRGLFRTKTCWGHEESYYNELYNTLKKYNLQGAMKKVQSGLGRDASNQRKVQNICREYIVAEETFANILSSVATGGEAESYAKMWLPNCYSVISNLIKEVG